MFEGRKMRIARMVQQVEREDRLEAPMGGFFQLLLALCMALLFAMVVMVNAYQQAYVVAAVFALLLLPFVVGLFEVVRLALRPGPLMAMDARGIDHAAYGHIEWRDVVGLKHATTGARFGPRQTLTIKIRSPRKQHARLSWILRWVHRDWLTTPSRYVDIVLRLEHYQAAPKSIFNTALRLRRRLDARFLTAWFSGPDDSIDVQLDYYEALADQARERTDVESLRAASARLDAANVAFRQIQTEWMARQFPKINPKMDAIYLILAFVLVAVVSYFQARR